MIARGVLMVGVLLAARGEPLRSQSLPPYAPLNPAAQMRSGLTTLPWLSAGPRWRVSVTNDYGNLIEYTEGTNRHFVLDAEVLAARLLVSRRLGARGFVLAEAGFNGSYDGFLDGFLDWYHRITGWKVRARELRPKNEYAYELGMEEQEFSFPSSSGFLGDVRLGAGVKVGRDWQGALMLTLPTGTAPAGYRKGVVSTNAVIMFHRDFGKGDRFTYEGSLGWGYTPKHGDLRPWQRTSFVLVSQGIRAGIAGPLHGFVNLIYDSPYYRDIGVPDLDRTELTLDAGTMFRFKKGPTWLLSMTQDLSPRGPAIDVAIRLGAYW